MKHEVRKTVENGAGRKGGEPRARGLVVKTHIRAGGLSPQHNETQARATGSRHAAGISVKTGIRAGGMELQHNEN